MTLYLIHTFCRRPQINLGVFNNRNIFTLTNNAITNLDLPDTGLYKNIDTALLAISNRAKDSSLNHQADLAIKTVAAFTTSIKDLINDSNQNPITQYKQGNHSIEIRNLKDLREIAISNGKFYCSYAINEHNQITGGISFSEKAPKKPDTYCDPGICDEFNMRLTRTEPSSTYTVGSMKSERSDSITKLHSELAI